MMNRLVQERRKNKTKKEVPTSDNENKYAPEKRFLNFL